MNKQSIESRMKSIEKQIARLGMRLVDLSPEEIKPYQALADEYANLKEQVKQQNECQNDRNPWPITATR